jgi:hypothetical protein
MKYFRVELKVCEACGALWLRAADHGVYCRGCALWLSDFPASIAESHRVQRGKNGRFIQQQARPTLRLAVCAGGSR